MKGIIIFGTMGAGKDTLAGMLRERIFCSKIYKLGEDIRGLVDRAYPENVNRKLYQDYGQSTRQSLGIDVWNNVCKNKIDRDQAEYRLLFPIIADGRQLNEHEFWLKQGFYIVGITTPMYMRFGRLLKRDGSCDRERMFHETELQAQFVATQQADYEIDNGAPLSAGDLKAAADRIAEIIKNNREVE